MGHFGSERVRPGRRPELVAARVAAAWTAPNGPWQRDPPSAMIARVEAGPSIFLAVLALPVGVALVRARGEPPRNIALGLGIGFAVACAFLLLGSWAGTDLTRLNVLLYGVLALAGVAVAAIAIRELQRRGVLDSFQGTVLVIAVGLLAVIAVAVLATKDNWGYPPEFDTHPLALALR